MENGKGSGSAYSTPRDRGGSADEYGTPPSRGSRPPRGTPGGAPLYHPHPNHASPAAAAGGGAGSGYKDLDDYGDTYGETPSK
eukprot:CAMPEP_0202868404 /NCGR_PEP_ID=MMETSP1391-20130828/10862_1 /ASSEMBLY_ACC=CAM_ASM_000867 /TAXON_ID=1034604 /ORGANISM="Chlamydomonas leiostraca, Strain SAG 11-49" /LENGTH=82 /DNA_ID=CAMNT_0049548577 /DNA_START=339 /DNA_END=584 /DNA_ORIENTATION=+